MASLSETFEMIKQAEFESKLAALQELWAEDDGTRIELLDEALDMIKTAQVEGQLPEMDEAQILDLAVTEVESYIAENQPIEKEASEDELQKTAELEQVHLLGQLAGEVLAEEGLTVEDLEKVASEQEAEELGRYCAQRVAEKLAKQAE